MTHLAFPSPARAQRFWTWAQWIGLAATATLLAGLVLRPEATLTVLWDLVIPVLPATFLVAPALWRNVCPLATLNMLSNGLASRRRLVTGVAPWASVVGIALLVVLVPARHFLFNTNGPALAVIIVAVALVAFALGAFFDAKAGFCNAICPVLPVERLYGQRPLLDVDNARCSPCTTCAARGCLDLSATKSVAQTLGPARRTSAWLATPFGAFAAAFPGFVVGYFTVTDGPISQAGAIYGNVVAWMAASWIATALVVTVFRVGFQRALLALGGGSLGLYYWFAAPVIVGATGGGDAAVTTIRALAAILIVVQRREPRTDT